VREALCSVLGKEIVGARVLDAFSGSGILAFELLSRGAAVAVVIEKDGNAQECIIKSAQQLSQSEPVGRLVMKKDDCLRFLGRERQGSEETFDIVLLDPPYKSNLCQKAVELLVENHWLHAQSVVVIERAQRDCMPTYPKSLAIQFQRRYGDTELVLLTQADTRSGT